MVARTVAVIACVPIVLYCLDAIQGVFWGWFKTDWGARPFVYFSGSAILLFVVYSAGVTAACAWLARSRGDKYFSRCAIASGGGLLLYGLAFLSLCAGVL